MGHAPPMGLRSVLAASMSSQQFWTAESRLCPGGDKGKARAWRRRTLADLRRGDPLAWAFGVSPFAYVLLAAVEWSYASRLAAQTSAAFPWRVEAALFFFQGIFSFLSDVVWFGVRPPFRLGVLDRVSAVTLVAVQFLKFALHAAGFCGFVHGLSWDIVAAYLLTVPVVSLFLRGKQAALDDNRRMFLLCHTGWHVTAPAAFMCYVWRSLQHGHS